MSLKNKHPNFICIGPEKTGTSWLYTKLKKHPQVFLPPVKEIRYFWEKVFLPEQNLVKRFTDSHWHNVSCQKYLQNRRRFYFNQTKQIILLKKDILKRLIWDFKYLFLPRTENWYSSLFKVEGNLVSGDITPLYYRLPETEIYEISRSFPNLKIIIILINHIDRSWSKAKMNLCVHRKRKIEEVNQEEFYYHFDEEFKLLPSYRNLINLWKNYFPPENIHVNFYDKMAEDPLTFLSDICNFIEVDINKIPNYSSEKLSKKVNRGLEINIPNDYSNYLIQLYSNCIEEVAKDYPVYPQRWVNTLIDLKEGKVG